MAGRVPLARRNLGAEPRRLGAAAVGVGLALMLILLLDGLWAGIEAQTTVYEDRNGADLYVAQPGSRNLLTSTSVIPASTVDRVRADPDVVWAAPVRGLFSITQLHDAKVPTYLIGSVPGQRGGPWSMSVGRGPVADDEIVVGESLGSRHGVRVGDRVEILGRGFTVTGIAEGADTFMASFIFMSHAATDAVLQAPGSTSFVLIGTSRPDRVRERLAATGLAVLDRDELKANDLAVMTRAFAVPIRVMVGVGFAVGSLVIALTAYSAIVERRREYGIVKALGASRGRLYRMALGQTLLLAVAGLAAGVVLFVVGRGLIDWARPQFAIVITTTIVARVIVAAGAMALVAAVVPARRLTRLDPATAYRGG